MLVDILKVELVVFLLMGVVMVFRNVDHDG
jgi:hypothetical protein